MSDVYDTDLLIKLLDGELPETEKQQLILRLQTDPELRTEWEAVSGSRELLQLVGQKKKIALIHREMMAERSMTDGAEPSVATGKGFYRMFPGRTVKLNVLRMVAAVLVLMLSAVLYPYFTATPEKLFATQFEVYRTGDLRGDETSVIAGDYRSGNREKTIADFKAGLSTGPQDDFLAAGAYLQLRQPLAAADAFQAVLEANRRAGTHFLEPETQYYLALSWLAAGQPKKALPLITAIRTDRNNPYHDAFSWWFMQKLRRLASR